MSAYKIWNSDDASKVSNAWGGVALEEAYSSTAFIGNTFDGGVQLTNTQSGWDDATWKSAVLIMGFNRPSQVSVQDTLELLIMSNGWVATDMNKWKDSAYIRG